MNAGTQGTDGDYMEVLRALIGIEAPPIWSTHVVEASELRRFIHATMDGEDYGSERDEASAGDLAVAPPAFPVHMFRRGRDEADPLDAATGSDFDGLRRVFREGLPPIEAPFTRLLNGGYSYEFFRLARVGERLRRISRYHDIVRKEGRSGLSLFVQIEDNYTGAEDAPLLRVVETIIFR